MDEQQWRTQSSLDAPDSPAAVTSVPATPPRQRHIPWLLIWASLGVAILLGTIIVIWFLRQTVLKTQANDRANSVKVQTVDTAAITGKTSAIDVSTADKVVVNGELQTNQSFILTPTNQPANGVTGQLFIDQTTKQFKYYNGTAFVTLANQGSIDALTNTVNGFNTNIANALAAANANLANFSAGLSSSAVTSLQNQTGTVTLAGTGGLTVSSGGGTVTLALPQNLTTTANPTFAGLTLGSALTVANGGTGQTSFTANQLLIGNGTGGLQTISAAAPGLCLQSTAGAPIFTTCSGSGAAVSDVNGQTGSITIANATGAGGVNGTITIDNASTSTKGIASFNSTNFTASSGAINTVQDISTGSSVTFATITSSGTVTAQGSGGLVAGVGSTTVGKLSLKNATNNNSVTIQSGVTSSNLTFTLPTADGSSGQCLKTNASGVLSFGDCLNGSSSGVSSLDSLTGALTLANSSGSGSTITIDNASTSTKGIASFNSTNFTASSGAINTIQDINTTATPQFTGVLAGSLERASSGTLSLGTTSNTTALTVGRSGVTTTNNGSVTIAQNLTVTAGATSLTGATSGDALTVNNSTSNGNILVLKDNGSTVFTARDGGTFLLGSGATAFGGGAYPTGLDVEHNFNNGESCLVGCNAIIGNAKIGSVTNPNYSVGVAGGVNNFGSSVLLQAIALDALAVSNTGSGAIGNAYGLYVNSQTAGAVANIGAAIEASGTQTLWVGNNTNSTTAAGGIAFGSFRDTALYRSAAATLKTDGLFMANTLQAASLDTASSGTLSIGTSNATGVQIGSSGIPLAIASKNVVGTSASGLSIATQSNAATSQNLNLSTGAVTGSGSTGVVVINSGSSSGGTNVSTGNIQINAGTPSGTGTAGNILIGTATASPTIAIGSTSSGSTLLQSASGVQVSTLGTANTSTYLCRNSSNVISTCSGTATGSAFVQGGNAFGATAVLGTTDSQSLAFQTANTTRLTLDTSGNLSFAAGAAHTLKVADQTVSNTAGNGLTIAAGAGNGTGAGADLTLQGGSAGTSGVVNGGSVNINGGTQNSTGAGGSVNLTGAAAGSYNGGTLTVGGASAVGPGTVTITGGSTSNTGTGTAAGAVSIMGGAGTAGNLSGGLVVINGGQASGSGSKGTVLLQNAIGTDWGNVGIGGLTSATARLHVSSSTSGLDILKVTDATTTAADVFTIADGGGSTFKTQSDTTTAFRILNSTGGSLFNVDTSGGKTTFKSPSNVSNAFQIQDSSSTALFNVDTNGNGAVSIQAGASGSINIGTTNNLTVTIGKTNGTGTLIVNGLASFNNSIVVVGHLNTDTQSSLGKVTGSCGTGCTTSVAGNDIAGTITINTGTGAAAGSQITINFGLSYSPRTPIVTLTPATVPASSNFPQYYATSTATNFDLGVYTPLTDSKTYTFFYHVLAY